MSRSALEARVLARAADRLKLAAPGCVTFGIVCTAFSLYFYPSAPWWVQALYFWATGFTVVVYRLSKADRVRGQLIPGIGAAMMCDAVIVTAVSYAATAGSYYFVIIAVLIPSAGALQIDRRWMLFALVFSLAVWIPTGFATIGKDFALQTFILCMLAVLSLLVFEIMTRYLTMIESLRERDQAHEQERQQLREQLFHSQKLESLGTLAGGVAHDMNNVLAAILGTAELLLDDASEPVREDLNHLIEAGRRGAELTRNLLGFARRGSYRKVSVDVRELVQHVVKILNRTLPKGVTIEIQGEVDRAIDGDLAQLSHALMNLCLNASDAMKGAGTLTLEFLQADLDETQARTFGLQTGSYIVLSVTDTGTGVTEEVKRRMFEPFFTTKPQGKGTGLGLAMVYGTVKNHGGEVRIDSELGKGTTVTLYLPTTARLATADAKDVIVPLGKGAILVVDDEPQIREVTRRALERAGYEVTCASNGKEAVDIVSGNLRPDFVVLDMMMPVMGGFECFHRLRELIPSVQVALVSGYALEAEAQTCLDRGACAFLEKPYRSRALLELVALSLDQAMVS